MLTNVHTCNASSNRSEAATFPEPYSIDPDLDIYEAGLLFNKLEATYQAARVRAGVAL